MGVAVFPVGACAANPLTVTVTRPCTGMVVLTTSSLTYYIYFMESCKNVCRIGFVLNWSMSRRGREVETSTGTMSSRLITPSCLERSSDDYDWSVPCDAMLMPCYADRCHAVHAASMIAEWSSHLLREARRSRGDHVLHRVLYIAQFGRCVTPMLVAAFYETTLQSDEYPFIGSVKMSKYKTPTLQRSTHAHTLYTESFHIHHVTWYLTFRTWNSPFPTVRQLLVRSVLTELCMQACIIL